MKVEADGAVVKGVEIEAPSWVAGVGERQMGVEVEVEDENLTVLAAVEAAEEGMRSIIAVKAGCISSMSRRTGWPVMVSCLPGCVFVRVFEVFVLPCPPDVAFASFGVRR